MNLQHIPPLLLVLALHTAALVYAMAPNAKVQTPSIEPPTLSGVLLPAPTKPVQTPLPQPRQQPVEKQVEKPKVKPKAKNVPLPKGPASERAVQTAKSENCTSKASNKIIGSASKS
ncbi:MAG: hypothetical protein U5L01_08765 [Rheinheimera sp.]|nr:hypothetical protein [Rheinheimera sp.]